MSGIFRTKLLSNDNDRNWTYFWNRQGNLNTIQYFLGDKKIALPRLHLGWICEPWENRYHGGLVLSSDLKLSNNFYKVNISESEVLTLSVDTLPQRPKLIVPAGMSVDRVQNYINLGYDIFLSPGLYEWDKSIILPNNSKISGFQSLVRRIPNNDYQERIFIVNNNCTIDGLAFESSGMIFHSVNNSYGLVVKNSTFKRCNFGWGMKESLIQDCIFDGGYCGNATPGLYLRCKWIGPNIGTSFSYGGPSNGELALIDCEFNGTDRALAFNALYGSITNNLVVGLRCHGINWTSNGNEIILCEGTNEFSHNLFFHGRIWGCESAVFQFDRVANNNYARDFSINGGNGIWLWGEKITNNTFEDFQLSNGAGVVLGEGAKNNLFINSAIINFIPGRANQTWMNPSAMDRRYAVMASGPDANTNVFRNVKMISMPSDIKPYEKELDIR